MGIVGMKVEVEEVDLCNMTQTTPSQCHRCGAKPLVPRYSTDKICGAAMLSWSQMRRQSHTIHLSKMTEGMETLRRMQKPVVKIKDILHRLFKVWQRLCL